MSDCVFCKIRDGQIPAKLVMRDERCIAFEDINPQAPVHVLFVPLEHIPSNNAVTPEHRELVGHLALQASRVAAERGIAESGYRLVMNTGPDACQNVFHLHLHLLGGRQLKGPMG
jgi:histidine triad (HIT) family protein